MTKQTTIQQNAVSSSRTTVRDIVYRHSGSLMSKMSKIIVVPMALLVLVPTTASADIITNPVMGVTQDFETVPVYGSMVKGTNYYADFGIGESGKKVQAYLTSNGMTVVACDVDETLWTPVSCNDEMCVSSSTMGCDQNRMCVFKEFVKDSTMTGQVYKVPQISLGNGQTVSGIAVGCDENQSSGVMGLGLDGTNSFVKQYLQASTFKPMFSICISDFGGSMTFGEPKTSTYGMTHQMNHTTGGFNIPAMSVHLGNEMIAHDTEVVLAVERLYSEIPAQAFEKLNKKVKQACMSTANCEMVSEFCVGGIEDITVFPQIHVTTTTESNHTIVFEPHAYLQYTPQHRYCISVVPADTQRLVLGKGFFKNNEITVDTEALTIAVVPRQCPVIQTAEFPTVSGQGSQVDSFDSKVMNLKICEKAGKAEFCAQMDEFDTTCTEMTPQCNSFTQSVVDVVEHCDLPMFGYHNKELCEMVRYRIQKAQQFCANMDTAQASSNVCKAVDMATEMMQSKCANTNFATKHSQTCEDNQHYFVEMLVMKCANPEFASTHTTYCDRLCEIVGMESKMCQTTNYYVNHPQACDYQKYFNEMTSTVCRTDPTHHACMHFNQCMMMPKMQIESTDSTESTEMLNQMTQGMLHGTNKVIKLLKNTFPTQPEVETTVLKTYTKCQRETYFTKQTKECKRVMQAMETVVAETKKVGADEELMYTETIAFKKNCINPMFRSEHFSSCKNIVDVTKWVTEAVCTTTHMKTRGCFANMVYNVKFEMMQGASQAENVPVQTHNAEAMIVQCYNTTKNHTYETLCTDLISFVQTQHYDCMTNKRKMFDNMHTCEAAVKITTLQKVACEDSSVKMKFPTKCVNAEQMYYQQQQMECVEAKKEYEEICEEADRKVYQMMNKCTETSVAKTHKPVCDLHRFVQNQTLESCTSKIEKNMKSKYCERQLEWRDFVDKECVKKNVTNNTVLCGDMNYQKVHYMVQKCMQPDYYEVNRSACRSTKAVFVKQMFENCQNPTFKNIFAQVCTYQKWWNIGFHVQCMNSKTEMCQGDMKNIIHQKEVCKKEQQDCNEIDWIYKQKSVGYPTYMQNFGLHQDESL